MEFLLPSEIARLVYGYLVDEKCTEAAHVFLTTSEHLKECYQAFLQNRKFSTKVMGFSLLKCLDQFCAVNRLVQEKVAASDMSNISHYDLVDQLSHLFDVGCKGHSTVMFNITVPTQDGQNTTIPASAENVNSEVVSTPSSETSNCLSYSVSMEGSPSKPTWCVNNTTPPQSNFALPITPAARYDVDAADKIGNIDSFNVPESTSLDSLPGTTKGPKKVPKHRKKEQVPVAKVLKKALQDEKLHERIADNINKVISTPEKFVGEKVKENSGGDELESVIKTIVNQTQKDPYFENFLNEFFDGTPKEPELSNTNKSDEDNKMKNKAGEIEKANTKNPTRRGGRPKKIKAEVSKNKDNLFVAVLSKGSGVEDSNLDAPYCPNVSDDSLSTNTLNKKNYEPNFVSVADNLSQSSIMAPKSDKMKIISNHYSQANSKLSNLPQKSVSESQPVNSLIVPVKSTINSSVCLRNSDKIMRVPVGTSSNLVAVSNLVSSTVDHVQSSCTTSPRCSSSIIIVPPTISPSADNNKPLTPAPSQILSFLSHQTGPSIIRSNSVYSPTSSVPSNSLILPKTRNKDSFSSLIIAEDSQNLPKHKIYTATTKPEIFFSNSLSTNNFVNIAPRISPNSNYMAISYEKDSSAKLTKLQSPILMRTSSRLKLARSIKSLLPDDSSSEGSTYSSSNRKERSEKKSSLAESYHKLVSSAVSNSPLRPGEAVISTNLSAKLNSSSSVKSIEEQVLKLNKDHRKSPHPIDSSNRNNSEGNEIFHKVTSNDSMGIKMALQLINQSKVNVISDSNEQEFGKTNEERKALVLDNSAEVQNITFKEPKKVQIKSRSHQNFSDGEVKYEQLSDGDNCMSLKNSKENSEVPSSPVNQSLSESSNLPEEEKLLNMKDTNSSFSGAAVNNEINLGQSLTVDCSSPQTDKAPVISEESIKTCQDRLKWDQSLKEIPKTSRNLPSSVDCTDKDIPEKLETLPSSLDSDKNSSTSIIGKSPKINRSIDPKVYPSKKRISEVFKRSKIDRTKKCCIGCLSPSSRSITNNLSKSLKSTHRISPNLDVKAGTEVYSGNDSYHDLKFQSVDSVVSGKMQKTDTSKSSPINIKDCSQLTNSITKSGVSQNLDNADPSASCNENEKKLVHLEKDAFIVSCDEVMCKTDGTTTKEGEKCRGKLKNEVSRDHSEENRITDSSQLVRIRPNKVEDHKKISQQPFFSPASPEVISKANNPTKESEECEVNESFEVSQSFNKISSDLKKLFSPPCQVKPSRLSSSTPRNKRSHVRALDFNTPPNHKDRMLKKANTSPKLIFHDKVFHDRFKNICRSHLFKSPNPKVIINKKEGPGKLIFKSIDEEEADFSVPKRNFDSKTYGAARHSEPNSVSANFEDDSKPSISSLVLGVNDLKTSSNTSTETKETIMLPENSDLRILTNDSHAQNQLEGNVLMSPNENDSSGNTWHEKLKKSRTKHSSNKNSTSYSIVESNYLKVVKKVTCKTIKSHKIESVHKQKSSKINQVKTSLNSRKKYYRSRSVSVSPKKKKSSETEKNSPQGKKRKKAILLPEIKSDAPAYGTPNYNCTKSFPDCVVKGTELAVRETIQPSSGDSSLPVTAENSEILIARTSANTMEDVCEEISATRNEFARTEAISNEKTVEPNEKFLNNTNANESKESGKFADKLVEHNPTTHSKYDSLYSEINSALVSDNSPSGTAGISILKAALKRPLKLRLPSGPSQPNTIIDSCENMLPYKSINCAVIKKSPDKQRLLSTKEKISLKRKKSRISSEEKSFLSSKTHNEVVDCKKSEKGSVIKVQKSTHLKEKLVNHANDKKTEFKNTDETLALAHLSDVSIGKEKKLESTSPKKVVAQKNKDISANENCFSETQHGYLGKEPQQIGSPIESKDGSSSSNPPSHLSTEVLVKNSRSPNDERSWTLKSNRFPMKDVTSTKPSILSPKLVTANATDTEFGKHCSKSETNNEEFLGDKDRKSNIQPVQNQGEVSLSSETCNIHKDNTLLKCENSPFEQTVAPENQILYPVSEFLEKQAKSTNDSLISNNEKKMCSVEEKDCGECSMNFNESCASECSLFIITADEERQNPSKLNRNQGKAVESIFVSPENITSDKNSSSNVLCQNETNLTAFQKCVVQKDNTSGICNLKNFGSTSENIFDNLPQKETEEDNQHFINTNSEVQSMKDTSNQFFLCLVYDDKKGDKNTDPSDIGIKQQFLRNYSCCFEMELENGNVSVRKIAVSEEKILLNIPSKLEHIETKSVSKYVRKKIYCASRDTTTEKTFFKKGSKNSCETKSFDDKRIQGSVAADSRSSLKPDLKSSCGIKLLDDKNIHNTKIAYSGNSSKENSKNPCETKSFGDRNIQSTTVAFSKSSPKQGSKNLCETKSLDHKSIQGTTATHSRSSVEQDSKNSSETKLFKNRSIQSPEIAHSRSAFKESSKNPRASKSFGGRNIQNTTKARSRGSLDQGLKSSYATKSFDDKHLQGSAAHSRSSSKEDSKNPRASKSFGDRNIQSITSVHSKSSLKQDRKNSYGTKSSDDKNIQSPKSAHSRSSPGSLLKHSRNYNLNDEKIQLSLKRKRETESYEPGSSYYVNKSRKTSSSERINSYHHRSRNSKNREKKHNSVPPKHINEVYKSGTCSERVDQHKTSKNPSKRFSSEVEKLKSLYPNIDFSSYDPILLEEFMAFRATKKRNEDSSYEITDCEDGSRNEDGEVEKRKSNLGKR